MSAVLEMTGVVKRYHGQPPVEALAGIDLTVHAGEFVALVGPSGSGKSTLINIDRRSGHATDGRLGAHRAGQRRWSPARRVGLAAIRGRRIGFVFQQFHLVDVTDRAWRTSPLACSTAGVPTRQRDRSRRASARPRSASPTGRHTGRATCPAVSSQRVAIARALIGDPATGPRRRADRATSTAATRRGDPVDCFVDLHAQGRTIVLITHDREIAARAPRRVTMRDGRVIEDDAAVVAPSRGRPGMTAPVMSSRLRLVDLLRTAVGRAAHPARCARR